MHNTVGEQGLAAAHAHINAYHAALRASLPTEPPSGPESPLPPATTRAPADDLESLARILHEVETCETKHRRKEKAELLLRSKLCARTVQAEPMGLFVQNQGQLL